MDGDDFARIGYLGILIVAIGGYLLVEYRGKLGQAARAAAAWGLIFVGVAAGYALWSDMRGAFTGDQQIGSEGEVTVPRSADGHYYLTLTIDGVAVDFTVDTGATNVVLSRDDAARLGFDLNNLVFLGTANTANGEVRTARVPLRNVALGPILDPQMTGYVNDGEMEGSLLGMDYLGRFRIEIAGDQMVLRR